MSDHDENNESTLLNLRALPPGTVCEASERIDTWHKQSVMPGQQFVIGPEGDSSNFPVAVHVRTWLPALAFADVIESAKPAAEGTLVEAARAIVARTLDPPLPPAVETLLTDLATALSVSEERVRQQELWAENVAAVAEQTNVVARDCIQERDAARAEVERLTQRVAQLEAELASSPMLSKEGTRALLESLANVASPEEIARRRAEARERLAQYDRKGDAP